MAWNEPPNQGNKQVPPDLEEALKRLNQKLNRFVSGKGPVQGGGLLAISLLAVFFFIWVLSGIFIVGPAEQAVVLLFGAYQKTLGPGPHWIPRFIKQKEILNVQRVSNYKYTAQMLNKDENIVSVSLAVQYRIADPKAYLFNVVKPSDSLEQATASALRQVVGQSTLDEVLTVGREKIRAEVDQQVRKILSIYNTGIMVTDVVMQPAKAPEEVKSAFDDAIKAQEDEQRYINQAQAYEARVRPDAEGRAKRILQEASAYKQQVLLEANGEVSRFLAVLPEYLRAKTVTKDRMYFAVMEKILEQTTKVVIDAKAGQSLMYLPFDKLLSPDVKKTSDNTQTLPEKSKQNFSFETYGPAVNPDDFTSINTRLSRDTYRGREDEQENGR